MFGLIGLEFLPKLHPFLTMSLVSISIAIGSIALVSSIPVLAHLGTLGSALGVQKCASNVGTSLMHQCSGYLQDFQNEDYQHVMIFLISMTGVSLLFAVMMILMDNMGKGLLKRSKDYQTYHLIGDDLEVVEMSEPKVPERNTESDGKCLVISLSILLILLASSWILGIYSLFKS